MTHTDHPAIRFAYRRLFFLAWSSGHMLDPGRSAACCLTEFTSTEGNEQKVADAVKLELQHVQPLWVNSGNIYVQEAVCDFIAAVSFADKTLTKRLLRAIPRGKLIAWARLSNFQSFFSTVGHLL